MGWVALKILTGKNLHERDLKRPSIMKLLINNAKKKVPILKSATIENRVRFL